MNESIQEQVAYRIRAELVCCDIYECIQAEMIAMKTVRPSLDDQGAFANAVGMASLRGTWHELCYWGEASARIAEGRCPGYETKPNICRCPCYGCKHHCSAHDESHIFEDRS